jgi:hypothetical protein
MKYVISILIFLAIWTLVVLWLIRLYKWFKNGCQTDEDISIKLMMKKELEKVLNKIKKD